jgi:hypothetical protein
MMDIDGYVDVLKNEELIISVRESFMHLNAYFVRTRPRALFDGVFKIIFRISSRLTGLNSNISEEIA